MSPSRVKRIGKTLVLAGMVAGATLTLGACEWRNPLDVTDGYPGWRTVAAGCLVMVGLAGIAVTACRYRPVRGATAMGGTR